MSGVEVAGLILGAFPLLITALEHYRESAEVLGDWWKFKRKYIKCKRDVEYHQITFTSNLEELLLPLIVDDDQLELLLASPGGLAWQDDALEKKLRERLPNAYNAYLDSINEINEVMKKLTQELGLDKEYLGTRISVEHGDNTLTRTETHGGLASRQGIEYQLQRVKFALGQSTRTKLFDEFAKYNSRLRDLLKTGDKISAARRARGHTSSSATAAFKQFWRHANSLYSLLARAWNCNCKSSHSANLLLQHRTVLDVEFNVSFLFSSFSTLAESFWTWQDTHIKIVKEARAPEPPPTPSFSTTTTLTASSSSTSRPSILRKLKKGLSSDSSSSLLTRETITSKRTVGWQDSSSSVTLESLAQTQPKIISLCNTFKSNNDSQPTCLGILKDEENCYSIHPHTDYHEHVPSSSRETITLKSLLTQTCGISLTRRQRYLIALTLASSQAQLQSTPWLGTSWSKTSIVFLRDAKNPTTILLDRPHLSQSFRHQSPFPPSSLSSSSIASSRPPDPLPSGTADRSITTLGILLLELCFGKIIEDHPTWQKYPCAQNSADYNTTSINDSNRAFFNLVVALEWSEQVNEEAGPEFASAIAWCLRRDNIVVANEDWRAELFANVVKPLQDCYQHLL